MNLLDRFAACALQGLLASHSGEQGYTFQEAAQWAYQYAQAMLDEKRTQEEKERESEQIHLHHQQATHRH